MIRQSVSSYASFLHNFLELPVAERKPTYLSTPQELRPAQHGPSNSSSPTIPPTEAAAADLIARLLQVKTCDGAS
jgi:hypothetical protein